MCVCVCMFVRTYVCVCMYVLRTYVCVCVCMYSGPSSYDRFDIRTTWLTTKTLVLTYDQILSYDPHAGQGHLSYELNGVRKLQSEPR
jgi:hypothetical protein